jgi:Ni,Fe-hydrogenase III small subunit/formate hydrogenlyase subunit 6/NADH:ubiquinone oxidoreductase subunit I
MFDIVRARLRQGRRTIPFPKAEPTLPDRFRGRPELDASRCPAGCRACADACPTDAVRPDPVTGAPAAIDLGRCLFCTECTAACPTGALRFTTDYRLATRTREALVTDGATLEVARALDREALRLFGRSLRLRQVSAGGCNACEADVNVLGTIVFDLGRFGIQFVASPRHADGLLVTGPVTQNMRLGLLKTWEAVPTPKIVIAVGACAISGGPFAGHPEQHDGAAAFVPVDLFVPGCPPHPLTILDGLLRLLARR